MKLIADNLTCVRGGRVIFEGIRFEVCGGEVVAVTGPNGVGKTSLLRALAGVLNLECGTVVFEGGTDDEDCVGRASHYLGHLDGIKSSLTVGENLSFWQRYLNSPGAAPVAGQAALLDALGLAGLAEVPAGYLSAGQKRRLGLARLLAARRPVWLLDEPFVSLDAVSIDRLRSMIEQHVGTGGLAVVATHGDLGIAGVRELQLAPSEVAA